MWKYSASIRESTVEECGNISGSGSRCTVFCVAINPSDTNVVCMSVRNKTADVSERMYHVYLL